MLGGNARAYRPEPGWRACNGTSWPMSTGASAIEQAARRPTWRGVGYLALTPLLCGSQPGFSGIMRWKGTCTSPSSKAPSKRTFAITGGHQMCCSKAPVSTLAWKCSAAGPGRSAADGSAPGQGGLGPRRPSIAPAPPFAWRQPRANGPGARWLWLRPPPRLAIVAPGRPGRSPPRERPHRGPGRNRLLAAFSNSASLAYRCRSRAQCSRQAHKAGGEEADRPWGHLFEYQAAHSK